MADFDPPFANANGDIRMPTSDEIANGFGCGPADIDLFNGLWNAAYSELGGVLLRKGITPSNSDMGQVAKAIFDPWGPMTLAPSGGQVAILATDHNRYFERDVATNGGFALPSLASTPLGTLFTVKCTGSPISLPLPAITISGGGNIIVRGIAQTSVATLGRSETLSFRRIGAGYQMEVVSNSERVDLAATDTDTTWISGPSTYSPIPLLTLVSGGGYQTFNFTGNGFFAPVTGQYFIQLGAQFNANGGAAGAGIAISPSPFTTTSAAVGYQYFDFPAGSIRPIVNCTNILVQGQVLEFDYVLLNAASRIRKQDFGVNLIYLGR